MFGQSFKYFGLALATAALIAASPALAQAASAIPEPSDALVFGLGLAGLVIGRYAARRPPEG